MAELLKEIELWRSPMRQPFASFGVNSHFENRPINSEWFRNHLRWRALRTDGSLLGPIDIEKVCSALSAIAAIDGPEYPIWTRVGTEGTERLYVDLGDDDWRSIEVGPADMRSDGPHWKIIDKPPVKFVRRPSMQAMTTPQPGGSIDQLRRFLSLETEDDFRLVVGWILSCFRPRGPYPILVINGTQGSGKTNMLRALSRLIDPVMAPERSLPRDERDLFVAAQSSHLQTFDNLSGFKGDMADALCRMATGGGYSTRALHTNDDEHILQARKPIVLNGIPDLARRADLADRAIIVRTAQLTPDRRRTEEEFWNDFASCQGQILGVLLDAIAYGLATYRDVPPLHFRMADAARFMSAGCQMFGWEAHCFGALLQRNRRHAIDAVIESDPFAQRLLNLLEQQPDWRGTTSELRETLIDRAPDRERHASYWPQTTSATRAALDRIKDALEEHGFAFERGREGPRNERRFLQFRRTSASEAK